MAGTAGRGWALLGGLAALAMLQPGGCGGTDPGGLPPAVEDAMTSMLADFWPHVLEPALADAQADADALRAAAEAWAEAERTDTGADEARDAAQQAWHEAMGAWQVLEVMQVGPAGATTIGAESLRDAIYSYPTVNPCRVDQETVEESWQDADFLEVSLVNAYGFDALETLLFSPPGENDCAEQVDINSSGSWAALGVDGVQQNRADYAVVVAGGIVDALADLRGAWEGGFADTFASAGEDGSPYESQEAAVNEVFVAMYYLELETKDAKLAGPLGLWNCGESSCPGQVETPVAGGSNVWLARNLDGFRALFTGDDGAGLEDLLRALGHDDVADDVLAQLDEADAAAAALTVPVDVAVAGDRNAAEALLAEIADVGALLKGDVRTLLALQPPAEGAGDAD